jgi:hypothetical protein
MSKSEIILRGIQVKSLEKAKKLACALDVIEKECGIHHVKITVEKSFICPDIDLRDLNETKMEELLADIFRQILDTER